MKLFKKSIIIPIILIGIIIIAAVIMHPKPEAFNKTFNDSFVTTDLKNTSKNSTIIINANLSERYSLQHFNIEKILVGNITIDNKKYILSGYNYGSVTNNVLFGEIKEKSTDKTPIYIFYMFDNLSSIYLSSFDTKQYIAAPAKTINDFETLREKIERKGN